MRLSLSPLRRTPWPQVFIFLVDLTALPVDFLVAITLRYLTGEPMNSGSGVVTNICGSQSASTFKARFCLTSP